MNKNIQKKIRPLYWNFRKIFLNNNAAANYLRNRILTNNNENQICPICNSNSITSLKFYFEQINILKYYCKECGHIFTNNLKADIEKGFQLFKYDNENDHINDQKYLLLQLEKFTRDEKIKNRKLLDFGISGNYRHLIELNGKFNNVKFDGCDIYPSERQYYFQCYTDYSRLSQYDGIVSNAVVEHLDDTIYSWKYLNKLLKPIESGYNASGRNGIMIHAFPSQINEDYLHWAVQIKSHECLFSKRSLSILCSKTGFELLKITTSSEVQHPIFFFKKIRNVI